MKLAALALSMTLGLAACDAAVPPPLGVESDAHRGPPQRGGVLKIATYTDLRTLDAAVAFDEVAHSVEQLLYATLIDFSPDGKGFVPDLADRYEVEDGGLRIRFRLRPALFHDGSRVTARDVKRSLERALHPDTPCPVSAFYERISGYKAFTGRKADELTGVKVLGDHELVIELDEPDATMLAVLALPIAAPVCPSAGDRYDRDFASKACGAGPYKLTSWEPGKAVVLERFAGYHDNERPYLDGIEWSLSMPTFTQRLKFERGDIDIVHELSESDLLRYFASPAWKGRGAWEPSRAIHSLFMNTEMAPFDNVELRRAVSAAIDREQIGKLRVGTIKPFSRLIPPAVPGYRPGEGQRHDLQAALEHMKKAGYAYDPVSKKGGYPHELTYVCVGDSFDIEAAQVYKQQLARIGIKMRIKMLGWPAYLAETARRRTTAFGADGWSADYLDPSDFFEPILSSRSISDEDSQNRSFYSNPAFDDLLDRARRETSFEARLALYDQAEAMVLGDAPWAITYIKNWYDLWHPYVHDYKVSAAVSQDVAWVWLDRGAKARALGAVMSPFTRETLARLGRTLRRGMR